MNITTYLKTISKFNLLTKYEEIALFKRIQSGDKGAREQAITANLRLAVNIAKRYLHTKIQFQDLIQEANKGLITAVDKFKPELDRRFSTYATFWIKQSVLRFLNDSKNVIRYPSYVVDFISKFSKFIQEYKRVNENQIPSIKTLAKNFDLSESETKKIRELMSQSYVSLEEQYENGNYIKSCDKNIDECLIDNLEVNSITDIINQLRGREKDIISFRYGLFGNEKMTLEKISEKMNLTRERVRQIQNSVVSKIRERMKFF